MTNLQTMTRKSIYYGKAFVLIAVLGLLVPFQAVFACDQMDEKQQLICCCDEPGMMGAHTTSYTTSHTTSMEGSSPDRCCDISIEEMYKVVSQGPQTQGYSLDHAQPPPVVDSICKLEVVTPDDICLSSAPEGQLAAAHQQVFLLTNRFLI